MLMQSHEGYIHLLPAVPEEWRSGGFCGLTARGGFAVSARWENGVVNEITAVSNAGGPLKLLVNGSFFERETKKGECLTLVRTQNGFS